MKIWVNELGEPMPWMEGQRLLRYGELTRSLAEAGHQVTWWACNFIHVTKTFAGEAGERRPHGGVDHVLVGGPGYRRNVGIERLRHIKAHAVNLQLAIEQADPPDVILTAMPTLEAAGVMIRYAQKRRIPAVMDIRDEWPEDYVRWAPRPLRGIARLALSPQFRQLRFAASHASALTAVSKRQLNYGLGMAGRVRADDDRVFPTGFHEPPTSSDPGLTPEELLGQYGVTAGDFVCTFAGTMSPSRPVGPLIQAVRKLTAEMPIKLILVGDGDALRSYERMASGADNIVFTGRMDISRLRMIYAGSDVLLAPYSEAYGFSMPTKLFDYMAAGKPMLSSCKEEGEALVRERGLGITYRSDDVAAVCEALRRFHHEPEERQEMGRRARTAFEEEFSTPVISGRFVTYLEELANRPVASPNGSG